MSNGGCEHECNNLPGGHYCSCRTGFYLNSNLMTCADVNECEDGYNGGCEQICDNIPGSNTCSCMNGYTELNSTHCQGKSILSVLIYSSC